MAWAAESSVRRLLAACVAIVLGCAGASCAGSGTAPGSIAVSDLDGRHWRPLAPDAAARATVLVFIATDCPIANAYAPEMAALHAALEAQAVRLFLVHADPHVTVAAAREHATTYALPGPIVIDRDHALVRATGVHVTPEAVLLDSGGRVVYRGRIDDAWADLGQRRRAASQRDLRAAVERVVAGRPIAAPWPPAVGCDIPEK